MDDAVLKSMLKWPGLPAVFGWLRLDRRGMWRIRTGMAPEGPVFEPIGNTAFREFIGRNYAADEQGRWYFQNGPQKVYAGLVYAPFVFRTEAGTLVDQCGTVSHADAAWLDEEGALLLRSGSRVGGLDDRDLHACAEELAEGYFSSGFRRIPVGLVTRSILGERFGFVAEPCP